MEIDLCNLDRERLICWLNSSRDRSDPAVYNKSDLTQQGDCTH